ncbi:hypothetical protein OSTOST_07426 [Ostertagia ostertagi]
MHMLQEIALHFIDDCWSPRARNVRYVRQDPRRNISVNQSLIRQRFRFTDEQLDWLTDLLSPMLGRDDQQPWAISKRMQNTGSHNIVQDAQLIDALAHPDIVQRFIKFKPEDAQWCRARSNEFARTGRMSNVIGAVDGTLVRLKDSMLGWTRWGRQQERNIFRLNVCHHADAVGANSCYVQTQGPGWLLNDAAGLA